jgi:rubrerythrin
MKPIDYLLAANAAQLAGFPHLARAFIEIWKRETKGKHK